MEVDDIYGRNIEIVDQNEIDLSDPSQEQSPKENYLINHMPNDFMNNETRILIKYDKYKWRMRDIIGIFLTFSLMNVVLGAIPYVNLIVGNNSDADDISSQSQSHFKPLSNYIYKFYLYLTGHNQVPKYENTSEPTSAQTLLEGYQMTMKYCLLPLGVLGLIFAMYALSWLSQEGVLKFKITRQIFYIFVCLNIILCIETLHYLFHLIWFWLEGYYEVFRTSFIFEGILVTLSLIWFIVSFYFAGKFHYYSYVYHIFRKNAKQARNEIELQNAQIPNGFVHDGEYNNFGVSNEPLDVRNNHINDQNGQRHQQNLD